MHNSINHNSKRARDDSDNLESNPTHPESKLIRVDSTHSAAASPESGSTASESNNSDVNSDGSNNSGVCSDESNNSNVNSDESATQSPVRVDSEVLATEYTEVQLIQDDLLNILDDSDTVTDRGPAIQDLDSVIKSFEEEIHVPAAFPSSETSSGSGESSQPELGYLLEASDDELGLPPTNGPSEEGNIQGADFTTSSSEPVGLDGMLGLENDIIPSYDAFDLGMGGDSNNNYTGGEEYVALDGLFDNSDGGVSDVSWRNESLSAV